MFMSRIQSFEFFKELLSGYAGIFMQLVFAVIFLYVVVMLINFFRDKFINKEVVSKKEDVLDLLTILYYLFFVSGIGFVSGNILQALLFMLSEMGSHTKYYDENAWDYLVIGVIFISIGLAFKFSVKKLKQDHKSNT
jgi:hypothetical protein